MSLNKTLFNILAIFLLIVIGAIVFSGVFKVPFHFDDNRTILKNQSIMDLGKRPLGIMLKNPTRPLFYLSLAVDYSFYGKENPGGYHLTNLAIHILNTVLLYLLVIYAGFGPDEPHCAALVSSFIFLLHPLTTESVTYISSRAVLFVTFFVLLSFLTFLVYQNKKLKRYYWLSFVLFIPGLGFKETAAVFPLILLLYLWIFESKEGLRKFFTEKFKYVIPHFLIIGGGLLYRIIHLGGLSKGSKSSFVYFINQFKVIPTYLKLSFLPVGLSVDHHIVKSEGFSGAIILGILLIGALLTLLFYLKEKLPVLSFGGFFYFISLLPSSSIIPLQDLIAEHRVYLALIGFSLVLSAFLRWGLSRWFQKKIFYTSGAVILAVLICVYGYLTFQRNKVWQSEISLWNDAVTKEPRQGRPYVNLAKAYLDKGQIEEALEAYKNALEYEDTYKPRVYLGIGYIHLKEKRNPSKALKYFRKSAEGNIPEAYAAVGYSLVSMKKFREAVEPLEKAVEDRPKVSLINYYLGECYLRLGNYGKAEHFLKRARRFGGGKLRVHLRLGDLYRRQNKLKKAIVSFRRAQRIKSNPRIERLIKKLQKRRRNETP